MGNMQSISSKDIGDKPFITETFLQNFHTHATIVDHSVAALARAIDAMVSSCTRDFNKQEGAPESGEKLLMTVLKATKDCIGDLKIVVTESVRNLLCFIIEECLGRSENVGEMCSSLSVYKYLQHIPEKVDGDDVVHLCKKSLNELKTECSSLREIISLKSETINNFLKREELYLKEIEFFKRKASELETHLGSEQLLTPKVDINVEYKTVDDKSGLMKMNEKVSKENDYKPLDDIQPDSRKDTTSDLEAINETVDMGVASSTLVLETPIKDIGILTKENERMKKENEDLKRKLDIMKRKQIIRVQFYHKHTFFSTSVKKGLIARLTNKLDDRRIELKTTQMEGSAAVDQNEILLVCCDYYPRQNKSTNTIKKAVDDCQVSSKTAVLIFHHTDEAGFKSDVENFSHDKKGIGAVFHCGYTLPLGGFGLNQTAIDGIAEFIISNGNAKKKYSGNM